MEMEYWILSQKWFKPRCESIRPEYSKQGTTNSHFNCDTTFHIIFHFFYFASFYYHFDWDSCRRNVVEMTRSTSAPEFEKTKKFHFHHHKISQPRNMNCESIGKREKKLFKMKSSVNLRHPQKSPCPELGSKFHLHVNFEKKNKTKQNKTSGSVGVVCVSYFIYFVIDGK